MGNYTVEETYNMLTEKEKKLKEKITKEYNDYMAGKNAGEYAWTVQIQNMYYPTNDEKTNLYLDCVDMIQMCMSKLDIWLADEKQNHTHWYWCQYCRKYINAEIKKKKNESLSVPETTLSETDAETGEAIKKNCDNFETYVNRIKQSEDIYDDIFGDDKEYLKDISLLKCVDTKIEFENFVSRCIDRHCKYNKTKVMKAIVRYGQRLDNIYGAAEYAGISHNTLRAVLQDMEKHGCDKRKLYSMIDFCEDIAIAQKKH